MNADTLARLQMLAVGDYSAAEMAWAIYEAESLTAEQAERLQRMSGTVRKDRAVFRARRTEQGVRYVVERRTK